MQYLLSIYQPDGPAPPPEILDPVMRDLDAALDWAHKATRATTLPIEVRPFQHESAG